MKKRKPIELTIAVRMVPWSPLLGTGVATFTFPTQKQANEAAARINSAVHAIAQLTHGNRRG